MSQNESEHKQFNDEEIRSLILRAELMQAKRSMKSLLILTIAFFAISGLLTLYRWFSLFID